MNTGQFTSANERHPSAKDYLAFGEKRLAESRRAAQILGNGFVQLDLLGFPDGRIYSAHDGQSAKHAILRPIARAYR